METFFSDYWPHIAGVITLVSTTAALVVKRFPPTVKYLKYLTVVMDIVMFTGKAVKNVAQKRTNSKTGSSEVHQGEGEILEAAPEDTDPPKG